MNKKLLIFGIIIMFVFITNINASEMCEVVSGTGQNVGDEVKCGTESFYVLSNDGETVKLFAKYNLDTGYEYYRTHIESLEPTSHRAIPTTSIDDTRYLGQYSYGNRNYKIYAKFIIKEPIKQDGRAIGMYESSIADPYSPEYGIYPIFDYGVNNFISPNSSFEGYFTDFELSSSVDEVDADVKLIKEYLNDYKAYLSTQGFDVKSINIITVGELNEVIKKETGSNLPLTIDVDATPEYYTELNFKIDNIKEAVSTKLAWLYQTTYWTRTGFVTDRDDSGLLTSRSGIGNNELVASPLSIESNSPYLYFVDTFGYLGLSHMDDNVIGAGIRPILTLNANQIKYAIRVIEKPEGTVEVVKSASAGDRITFKLQSKPGYKLASLTIKTAGGINVSYDAGELIMLEDGTIAINDNAFTMPADDVIIEPTWVKEEIEEKEEEPPVGEGEVENPKTGSSISAAIIVIGLFISLSLLIYRKKYLFRI